MPSVLPGSRDETVRLWDVRMGDQAGQLVTKHHQMVTSMDTNEHLLTTASLDNNVFVFDLRMLGQGPQPPAVSAATWINGGVLKVAIAGKRRKGRAADWNCIGG
jgi:WD40 repeat protein